MKKKNKTNKKPVALASAAVITLLVASIAVIGAAPFSTQQSQEQSALNLALDTETNSQEPDQRSPNVPSFSLEVTERSNSFTVPEVEGGGSALLSLSVQCNSDETVSGGGYRATDNKAIY